MAYTDHELPGATPPKATADYVEEKDLDSNDPTRFLSESHKAYLVERHGTLDLDPIPSIDPADPYNWPLWKVKLNTILHMCIADSLTENGQSEPGRFPRLHGYLHSRRDHLCLRGHS
jgi:hypothetical protein